MQYLLPICIEKEGRIRTRRTQCNCVVQCSIDSSHRYSSFPFLPSLLNSTQLNSTLLYSTLLHSTLHYSTLFLSHLISPHLTFTRFIQPFYCIKLHHITSHHISSSLSSSLHFFFPVYLEFALHTGGQFKWHVALTRLTCARTYVRIQKCRFKVDAMNVKNTINTINIINK